MYLISIYFDEKTNKIIEQYIKQVARETGNTFMLDAKVPPHITISGFETAKEQKVVDMLTEEVSKFQQGKLQWVTVGAFLPYVIYIAPVLNEHLHNISCAIYSGLQKVPDVSISNYYRPFQWLPHTTIGKKLSKGQLKVAFEVMQNNFGVFEGMVTKVGLAKTNPYRDVAVFEVTKR